MRSYNFAIIGVAGYIAPRHLQAIKNLNHNLLVSFDKNDSVGILDRYFPKSFFYNKFNEFKKKFNSLNKIDYTVILTPNHTHLKYIKFALSNGSNVICEKPLVISLNHLKQIKKLEKKYNKNVYTILQLRTLNVIKKIKKQIEISKNYYKIKVVYITPRGHWYQNSWKGDSKKSGGIIFNIGIHLLDVLCFLFGDYKSCKILKKNELSLKGNIKFKFAEADFFLSTNRKDLKKYKEKKVVRDFFINGKKIELAKNFENAHTDTYNMIIKDKDYGLNTVKNAIKLANELKK